MEYPYLKQQLIVPPLSKKSSCKTCLSVMNIFKNIAESTSWVDIRDFIVLVLKKAKKLSKNNPDDELVINICLRMLKVVREEALKFMMGENADFEENLTNRLFAVGNESYESVSRLDIVDSVANAIDELIFEIKSCTENLSELSLEFIHSDELILTSGYSRLVCSFLKHASKNGRNFKVVVCESFPENSGHKLAEELSNDGIPVILVPDSHVFGLMSRVNKVIVGCKTVYPDGTLMANVGIYGIMIAAKNFSIPVYVCLPQYKLSAVPFKLFKQSSPSFNVQPTADPSNCVPGWLDTPLGLLPPTDHTLASNNLTHPDPIDGPVVWSPRWERIPSGLVSLFLTNLNAHAPSYLYALGRELYHPADIKVVTNWN